MYVFVLSSSSSYNLQIRFCVGIRFPLCSHSLIETHIFSSFVFSIDVVVLWQWLSTHRLLVATWNKYELFTNVRTYTELYHKHNFYFSSSFLSFTFHSLCWARSCVEISINTHLHLHLQLAVCAHALAVIMLCSKHFSGQHSNICSTYTNDIQVRTVIEHTYILIYVV